jgi:hypothetical protein
MASSSRVNWADQAIQDVDEIEGPVNESDASAKLYEELYNEATPFIKSLYDDPLDELHVPLSGLSEINQRIKALNRLHYRHQSEGLIDIRFFYRMREELDLAPENSQTNNVDDSIYSKVRENFYPIDWCLEWLSDDEKWVQSTNVGYRMGN